MFDQLLWESMGCFWVPSGNLFQFAIEAMAYSQLIFRFQMVIFQFAILVLQRIKYDVTSRRDRALESWELDSGNHPQMLAFRLVNYWNVIICFIRKKT